MMTGRLRTSRAGLELIKSFEGFREQASRLPDGRWTIGYGHVRTAREGLTISAKDAEDLLTYDLKPVEDAIQSSVYAPLNQNQYDALVSLTMNISPGQFRDSDILRCINGGDFLSAAHGFDLWRKARIHGRVMVVDALVRRRAAEKAMFLEHPDGRPSAPTPLVTPELDFSATGDPARQQAAAPVGQPRPRNAEADDEHPNYAPPGGEIAEAVRRLAERTNEAVTPAPELALPPGASVEPPVAQAQPVESGRVASDAAETRRVVAERVARILERTERSIAEQQVAEATSQPALIAQTPPATAAKAHTRPAAPEVLEGLPDFDAPAAPRIQPQTQPRTESEAERDRRLIDDTEMFDPGRDPNELFVEAQRKAKIVNGNSKRLGPLSGRIVALAPWLVILVLSVLGLAIGLVDTFKDTSGIDSNVPRAAATVLAVFGMMLLMSLYFIFWPRSSGDEI
jgi:GH24 family phage-related lysozyme (muramidase)